MKCEETKEEFEGIFDFEKGEMISGKGIFEWKDNKSNKTWNCKGKIICNDFHNKFVFLNNLFIKPIKYKNRRNKRKSLN